MRISVEMKLGHRRALLALAEGRGEKGLSSVLAEAIDHYLWGETMRPLCRKELVSIAESLSCKDAKNLRKVSRVIRNNWR